MQIAAEIAARFEVCEPTKAVPSDAAPVTASNGALPVDSLIILAALREQRRATSEQLSLAVQKEAGRVLGSLETLVELGLLQAHGVGRGRSYTLSADLYRLLGEKAEYTRQAGFDRLQHEQMVSSFIMQHGRITRQETMALCRLTPDQAYKLLKQLVDQNILTKHGVKRHAYYVKA